MDTTPGRIRILEAAIDLVAERGYAGATMSEVCRRARVRPPAIYYHYGSKDGLIAAVVETVATAWLAELEESARAGITLDERVIAGLRGWRALIVEPRSAIMLLIRVQLECADGAPAIREALSRVMKRARSIIRGAIEGAVGPLTNSDGLAQIIVSLVQGAALRHHLNGDPDDLDRQLAEIDHAIRALVAARLETLSPGFAPTQETP